VIKPRRWPYVTTFIVAVSILLFLLTHARLQRETKQYRELESRILNLAAILPSVPVSTAQKRLIDAFRKSHPQDWESMAALRTDVENVDEIAQEMTELARRLDDFQRNSLTARFAVYPPHRSVLSSFTANFLNRDWLHLVFNMCFFWLAGGTLEDVWGKRLYIGILFVCSLFGTSAYAICYQGSLAPLMGASGMLAALMGFYVIRYPKFTIERGTALWVVRPHLLRFSSPVFTVFPIWLLGLMFWGKSAEETTNAAYLAEGCAFTIGIVLAGLLKISGVQDYVSQRVEAKMAWSVDPHIAAATECLQRGDLDSAIDEVNAQIAEKPFSVEAHEMLVSLYSRKGDIVVKYLRALEGLCYVHLKAANPEAAWLNYENYLNAGGQRMPASTWFQLARFAENQGDWARAVTEYQEFALAWPGERASVLALISTGRIQLQHFGRREEAKQLYTAAQNSPVPHSDWDEVIRKGLDSAGGGVAPEAKSTLAPGAARNNPHS
jgi:membrane associated rhomboid family serine protease